MPLGPEQGLWEEGIQQGAVRIILPDAWLHVDQLSEPVCGGDAQPARRRAMTAGGTEGSRRMRWSAACGAVSKALRASKERM